MSETRLLLGKIQTLRQRLEQTRTVAEEARSSVALLAEDAESDGRNLLSFEQHVEEAGEHDAQLDRIVEPLARSREDGRVPALPRQLTARARRSLERGRDLLLRLRRLADAFDADEAKQTPSLFARRDPLAKLYRETVALTDTALRLIPLFPDAASAQMRLCEGLDAILNVVASRLLTLNAGVERQRREVDRVSQLTQLLRALEAAQPIDKRPFLELAEEVLNDAQESVPLRFLEGDPHNPAHFVACHGLTTARVLARILRYDVELRGRPLDALLAALVHDAGMLRVPPEILAHAGPLDDEQRRIIESHCHLGVSVAAPLLLDSPWLAEAVRGHHERLDGTGYPEGLRDFQIKPLTRLLAVCDVYAACCQRRAHRPALETRTALTDTLLLAEQGQLDRHCAECLLYLSFYPIGSIVEMADGGVGVVVATPTPRRDASSPARPVVALLADSQGQALPLPHHVDLAQCDGPSIVRTLSTTESRQLLGGRFPEWL